MTEQFQSMFEPGIIAEDGKDNPATDEAKTIGSTSLFVQEASAGIPKDNLATSEAKAINDGSLESDAKGREHNRHQKFRDHINRATLIVFWSVVLCLVASIFIFTFHMVSATRLHFLDAGQLSTLKTILGGAILSSAMSGYVNNRMKD